MGKFLIERVLGEGGMCFVYAARHLQLDGRVAIKVLRPDVLSDAANPAEIVERFMREGRAASQIKSEHVVRIYDVGSLPGGGSFLVMEYLEGRDLDALLREHGTLPVEAAVDYLLQACEAVAEAHARGIIHRDLKPANLFLTRYADGSPFVKVLDFGISKIIKKRSRFDPALTGTANVVGTPHYMSPEQLRGSRDVDTRTDIWSLGAILHELLSGEPPFKGSTMPEICANILKDEPAPLAPLRPEVPAALEAIVHRCLQKDAELRYADLAELATELAPFATAAGRASCARITNILRSAMIDEGGFFTSTPRGGEAPWGSTDSSWSDETPQRRRRRRLALGFFAAVMVATGSLLVFAFAGGHPIELPEFIARYVEPAPPPAVPPPPEPTPATLTHGDLAQEPIVTDAAAAPNAKASASSASPAEEAPLALPAAPTPSELPTAATAAPTPSQVAAPRPRPNRPPRPVRRPTPRPAETIEAPRPPQPPADESLFEERK